jgi:isoquinoline 1-oxidoreductase beta subunit
LARWLPPAFQKGIDIDAIDSAADIPYDIPNLRVEYMRDEPPAVPTGFWRGVGPNNNVFAVESFMDELAKKAGKDPVVFRRDMLAKSPRLRAAVDLAASKAGWGGVLPARSGRGIAAQVAFGSFIATVIEVAVDEFGEVHLKKIVSAVDTGIVVNPDTVVAQLQGGLIFGLTAALYGEITIDKGRVQQSNYHDYRMLRIDQVPNIEVHLIQSGEAPGGIGETGTTAGPPALGNAIYAATAVRLRRMPIDRAALALRKST